MIAWTSPRGTFRLRPRTMRCPAMFTCKLSIESSFIVGTRNICRFTGFANQVFAGETASTVSQGLGRRAGLTSANLAHIYLRECGGFIPASLMLLFRVEQIYLLLQWPLPNQIRETKKLPLSLLPLPPAS